jgi:hypothetical protein
LRKNIEMKKYVISVALGFSLLMFPASAKAANIITNGDFELGNVGFISDYQFTSGAGYTGVYFINNNTYWPYWASYGDHTTGSGNMMIVDGTSEDYKEFWKQSVNVDSNNTYKFSIWTASSSDYNPADLDFRINGNSIGTFTLSTETGIWENYTADWNSGNNSVANISIIDRNLNGDGNDFAIDDISFNNTSVPSPEPSSIILGLLSIGSLIGFRKKSA